MRDRVIGLENEFAHLTTEHNPPDGNSPMDDATKKFRSLDVLLSNAMAHGFHTAGRFWHRNGGCLYIDQGKLEQASPECRRIADVVAYNKAAERLVMKLTEGPLGEPLFDFFKTSIAPEHSGAEHKYVALGAHENYLLYNMPSPQIEGSLAYHALLPFFVTRQVYGGAGYWRDARENAFYRSQRAANTNMVTSNQTTGDARGILNERWDAHMPNMEGLGRYHVIFGDANMLEYALYLKIGVTMLILAMHEEGRLPRWTVATRTETDPEILGSLHAFKAVSTESDLNRKMLYVRDLEFKSIWQRLSPLELQTNYCEKVHQYLKKTTFDSEESEHEAKQIAQMWNETLSALHRNDGEFLTGRIDWYTKMRLAEHEIKQNGGKGIERIRSKMDVFYHKLGDNTRYQKMVRSGIAKRMVTDEDIARACLAGPPETPTRGTRASVRSRAIISALAHNSGEPKRRMVPQPDWQHIQYSQDTRPPPEVDLYCGNYTISTADPLVYRSDVLEDFISKYTD